MRVTRTSRRRAWLADLGVLRHYPAVAVSVLVAGLVIGFTAGVGPLFAGAAGDATLRAELSGRSELALGLRAVTNTAAGPEADGLATVATALRQTATDVDGFGAPTVTATTTRLQVATGPDAAAGEFEASEFAELVARDGFAGHIEVLAGEPSDTGIWLPDELAAELGVGPGDEVAIAANPSGLTPRLEVAGVYRDLRTSFPEELPDFWGSISARFLLPPPGDIIVGFSPPNPTVLVDLETMGTLLAAAPPTPSAAGRASMVLEVPAAAIDELPLAQGRQLADDVAAIRAELVDSESAVGMALAQQQAQAPQMSSGIGGAIERIEASASAISAPIWLLTAFGLGVSAVVVVAAVAAGGQARSTEVVARLARGEGPAEQAVRTIREVAPATLVGALLGLAIAGIGVTVLGPAGAPPLRSLLPATLALLAGLSVAAGACVSVARVAVRSHLVSARPSRRQLRRVPWELVPGTLTLVAGYQLLTRGDALVLGDGGDVRIDVLILAFPMLAVVTGVGLGVRLLRPALGLARRVRPGGRAVVLLASRRLAAAPAAALGLVGASALAAGLLVYSSTVAASTEATVEAKRSVATGAEVVGLSTATAGLDDRTLAGIDVTVVQRLTLDTLAGGEQQLMAIDPATFPGVASMDERWMGTDPTALLAALGGTDGDPVPAILAGGAAPDPIDLGVSGEVPVQVVGDVPAFPGSGGRPTLIVDLATLDAASPASITARARSEVWAAGDSPQLRTALGGVGVSDPRSAEEVVARSGLQAYTWTLDLLRVLSVLGGLLAAVGVLVFLRARQLQRTIAYALACRMGLSRAAHRMATVAEVGVLLVSAAVIGTLCALGAAALTLGRSDPLPSLPPLPIVQLPAQLIGVVVAAVALLSIAAGWWVQRQADRTTTAEVLRLAR